MITAQFSYQDENEAWLVLVLEPTVFVKLMDGWVLDKDIKDYFRGKPIPPKVHIVVAYSPDGAWIEQQLKSSPTDNPHDFLQLLHDSLERKAIVRVGQEAKVM